jgi:crotonobetainyl-CoA:carnitine CoA-transferase CaiB-like acyl-CoA transferase
MCGRGFKRNGEGNGGMDKDLFAGLKVIDCASFIAAPAAAMVLSDFGADVIKIEPPGEGDAYRQLHLAPGYPVSEHNYPWVLDGRNKRSIALDLKSPDGLEVLHRLIDQADIFITNMPLPVRRRLNIRYEDLGPRNSRLIYASFTAYGETGAEADKTGFDSTAYWARSGLMDNVKPHADAPPARSLPGMGDHPSAMALYSAIVTALYRRDRTGKGGRVTSSLIANGLWANGVMVQAQLCGARMIPRPPRDQLPNACTNMYRCGDGRWLTLSLLNEVRQFLPLLDALERRDILEDPRFSTLEMRRENSRQLIAVFDHIFASRDLAEWRQRLDQAGITFGVTGTLEDISDDAQMREVEALVPFADGAMMTVNSPFSIDGLEKVKPRAAPTVGQHSEEILREAGYSDAEIQQLRGSKAVA